MLKSKVEQSRKFNKPIKLSLSLIRLDGGTQPRANLNHQTVLEYVEDMKNGDIFPPVVVFYDGTDFWLCDGFHRLEAAFGIGLTEIEAVVKQGTRRDAVLYSVGANAKHGLRRSNADKRRAVMRLLEDEEWCQWSDRAIAKKCGVSHTFVSKVRSSLTGNVASDNLNGDTGNLTGNVASDNLNSDSGNPTGNVASNNLNGDTGNLTVNVASNNPNERTYITKHGTEAKMNTANIGKSKTSESSPVDEVIPDTEQLNQDIEVPNLEENTPTNEAVDTPKTDEVNNDDDSAVDNEEAEVQADSKPKQSQRQRKGKQRLVNPLSVGDKVKVKDDHYFGGQEGVVTQLATPSTVIVAFDNDERDVIKLTDLDLPTELTKPILINESTSKPVKKEIIIKEGLNYKAGEGCRWYVEVPEFTFQGLKIYEKRIKCDGLGIGTALTRFLEGEGILIADPTRPLEYIINDEIKEKKPESRSFINKSNQRGFLPPDVEIKDSNKKTYSINIGRDTLMKIKKYIEGKPIYTAENAINLLLPD